jgi:SNF2 family DNA or RNA helicase
MMGGLGGLSAEAIAKPMHEYQHYAVNWMLERMFVQGELGAGLFLDPGLGKTRISLALIDALFQLGEIKRVLVVAPLRPVYSVWPREIDRWGFPQSKVILHDQYAWALTFKQQIELVNFAGLARIADLRDRWDLIIIDESTFAKTFTSKRAQRIRRMIKSIPRRVILTGTPAANSLADLHSQCFMLDNGKALGKNCGEFRNRFCQMGGWRGRKWLVRETVQDEIRKSIEHLVLCMKAEDYLDMPKLVENNIWCKMPADAYTQYTRLKRDLYAQLASGEVHAVNQASAYTKCKQFANGQVYSNNDDGSKSSHVAHSEKLTALCELHEELAGKPLLIGYNYNHDADRIRAMKNSPFRNTPVIRGRKHMKPGEADRIIEEWNAGKHHAVIGQWQAMGHGLNMQEGNCADVACFGIPDSLELYEQFYKRIFRQGNESPHVRLHRLLTEGTVEEVQNERLTGKYKTQAAFLKAMKRHAAGGKAC